MGIYEVEIQGDKFKASVIDNAAVLDTKINEFWSSLFQHTRPPVVEIDVKDSFDEYKARKLELLILCGWNSCLIIQLQILSSFPECLKNYFADESVCFVVKDIFYQIGSSLNLKMHRLLRDSGNFLSLKNVVKLGDLAARVPRKHYFAKYCVLSDLAKEVSVDYVEATSTSNETSTDWKAIAFTDEEIISAIQEAYRCYDLGNKLLTMVA